ncbi:MAG TPA: uracil-DNA glycosylase [Bacteroidia bacterium]|nr:uracil-DNA glycosylase [Bacteroidia bacterium]
MSENAIQMEESWKRVLSEEFQKPYFHALKAFLQREKQAGKTVYPPGKLIFNAFDSTPFEQVKVVIIGQDPYHGPGQAHGLSFSVPRGVATPPSLVNIYKEIQQDLGLPIPAHGNLEKWTREGVLLLNAMLTVEANQPASHQNKGWESFTDAAIHHLNDDRSGIVFLLWGSYAKKKGAFIDTQKHLVLTSSHPSPLSAHTGWYGNHHFSKANAYLAAQGKAPIDWKIE